MQCKRIPLWTKLINFLLKDSNIMSTIQEVEQLVTDMSAGLTAANTTLDSLDLKLDEILAFIQGLGAGSVVTQQQLDNLFASVNSAKVMVDGVQAKTTAALAEADALDDPQP